MRKEILLSGSLLVFGIYASGCAPAPPTQPAAPAQRRATHPRAPTTQMVFPPGSSLKAFTDQEIYLTRVTEVREKEGIFWFAGKGGARLNNDTSTLGSSTLSIEIQFPVEANRVNEDCRSIIEQGIPPDTRLILKGKGHGGSLPVSKFRHVGFVNLDELVQCELKLRRSR